MNVPTGSGKTLSSLRFALAMVQQTGMEKIIYAAPYKTILEQTAQVFRGILGDDEGIVEHHSDVVVETDNKSSLENHQLLTQRWNAPIVLTTTVQMLDTLFSGRSACVRRFSALRNCVILLDEVQCIPVRCWYLLTLAIRFLSRLAGCAIVLCTATQPQWESLPLFPMPKPVPLVRDEEHLYQAFKRVAVTDRTVEGEMLPETLTGEIIKMLPKTNSALCIANTKKTALGVYDALKAGLPEGVALYCLTTLQCPAHRLQLLTQIRRLLRENKPVVCVATQLIEAGVDISFGLTVRALAGLESVAQAAGRCNRNWERACGTVWLVRLAGEQLSALPEIKQAQSETVTMLNEYKIHPEKYQNDLLSPEMMELYFQTFMRENSKSMRYPDASLNDGSDLLDLLSTNHYGRRAYQDETGEAYNRTMAQAYRQAGIIFRALDTQTVSVLVPWGEAKEWIIQLSMEMDLQKINYLLTRLQRYYVAIYNGDFQKLLANHAITQLEQAGVWVTDATYYDDTLGLSTKRQEMEFYDI